MKHLNLESTRHLKAFIVAEVSAISPQPMRQVTSGQTTLSPSGFCGCVARRGGQAHKNYLLVCRSIRGVGFVSVISIPPFIFNFNSSF